MNRYSARSESSSAIRLSFAVSLAPKLIVMPTVACHHARNEKMRQSKRRDTAGVTDAWRGWQQWQKAQAPQVQHVCTPLELKGKLLSKNVVLATLTGDRETPDCKH